MNVNMQDMVFDTSILLLFFYKEEKYKKILRLLESASEGKIHIWTSEISLMEVHYKFIRILGEEVADNNLLSITELPLTFIPIDRNLLKIAAHFKALGGISLADAIIAATAKAKDLPLLTKDPEFLTLKNEIEVEML